MPLIPIAIELARHALPSLIGAIAGDKSEKVAKEVVDAALKTTGKTTPDEALHALQADPQLAHEYRLSLLAHQREMEQLGIEDRRREDVDRQAARVRDVDVRRIAGGENRRANLMVFADVVGLIVCVGLLGYIGFLQAQPDAPLSDGAAAALLTQLANLGAFFGLSLRDAHQFEFGSSRGSRTKDEAAAISTIVAQRKAGDA